jgi:hypothetical protein
VRKSLRNVKLISIGVGQLKSLPLAVGPRTGSDVDYDVPDFASHATHQLRLAVWLALIVHTPHRSLAGREGYAVLRIISLKPISSKLLDAKGAREKTTVVAHRLQLYEPGIRERC